MKPCQNGGCRAPAHGNFYLFIGGWATRSAWLCRSCFDWMESHGMDWRTDRRVVVREVVAA